MSKKLYKINGFVGTLNQCIERSRQLDLAEVDYKIERVED